MMSSCSLLAFTESIGRIHDPNATINDTTCYEGCMDLWADNYDYDGDGTHYQRMNVIKKVDYCTSDWADNYDELATTHC